MLVSKWSFANLDHLLEGQTKFLFEKITLYALLGESKLFFLIFEKKAEELEDKA